MPCSRHRSATSAALERIDPRGDEPPIRGGGRDGLRGATRVVVGDDHALEEGAAHRDRDDGAADTTGADDEDPHPRILAAQPEAYFHWNEPV